ncbi:hypothetical protein [Methylobacterium marchantiae]|uniref:Uncharacterized protein n=1 Tax=Methylobacterium marchantiae TaxID=600331 RepID=A0ABW3WX19_9HYPH|nr:hypothetical protein AIGOOFII_3136 [Methylobacterium marchantiae]
MTSSAPDIDPGNVAANVAHRRPTLTLDVALYDHYLEESALAGDDRRALLESLWAIIVGFVDLGFSVEPAATLADKSGGGCEGFACADSALVELSANSTTNHFEKAAADIASSSD